LENALERALALAGGDSEVQREALEYLLEEAHGAADQLAESVLAAGVSLEELTDALLRAAMQATRGNASAAARRLGLSRRTFGYRLRRWEQRQAGQEEEEGEEDRQA
jgi:transcriptional regulator of acetoin/glycerol metabolism